MHQFPSILVKICKKKKIKIITQPSQSVPMVWPAADCDIMCLGVIVTWLTAGGLTPLSLFFFTNQRTTNS